MIDWDNHGYLENHGGGGNNEVLQQMSHARYPARYHFYR